MELPNVEHQFLSGSAAEFLHEAGFVGAYGLVTHA